MKKDVTLSAEDFSKYNLWSKTNEIQQTMCCASLQKENFCPLLKGIMQTTSGDSLRWPDKWSPLRASSRSLLCALVWYPDLDVIHHTEKSNRTQREAKIRHL